MTTNAALTADREPRASLETLREVVEALAPLEREAGSAGEREAAEWLAARFESAGAPARVEEEEFLDGYAGLHARFAARRGRLRARRAQPPRPRRSACSAERSPRR